MARFVLGAACLVALSSALITRKHNCEGFDQVLSAMRKHSDKAVGQAMGCGWVAMCTDPVNKTDQDRAVAAGALEAAMEGLKLFPDSLEVQKMCISAISRQVMFNKEYGLRAGRLGALNMTIRAFSHWMNESQMTMHGGSIAAYLHLNDENRDLLRELGAVKLLIDNIKNNFHGKYSNFDQRALKGSLNGLAKATWKNQDLAYDAGFVPLSLQLLNEHPEESSMVEDGLLAVNAMMYASPVYRREYADGGLSATLAKVLKENPTNGGATSTACKASTYLVGPATISSPDGARTVELRFDSDSQDTATKAGLLTQLHDTITSGAELVYTEFDSFNAANNAGADCLKAMASMTYQNGENAQAMLKAGLADHVAAQLQAGKLNAEATAAACGALESLAEASKDPKVAATVQSLCK